MDESLQELSLSRASFGESVNELASAVDMLRRSLRSPVGQEAENQQIPTNTNEPSLPRSSSHSPSSTDSPPPLGLGLPNLVSPPSSTIIIRPANDVPLPPPSSRFQVRPIPPRFHQTTFTPTSASLSSSSAPPQPPTRRSYPLGLGGLVPAPTPSTPRPFDLNRARRGVVTLVGSQERRQQEQDQHEEEQRRVQTEYQHEQDRVLQSRINRTSSNVSWTWGEGSPPPLAPTATPPRRPWNSTSWIVPEDESRTRTNAQRSEEEPLLASRTRAERRSSSLNVAGADGGTTSLEDRPGLDPNLREEREGGEGSSPRWFNASDLGINFPIYNDTTTNNRPQMEPWRDPPEITRTPHPSDSFPSISHWFAHRDRHLLNNPSSSSSTTESASTTRRTSLTAPRLQASHLTPSSPATPNDDEPTPPLAPVPPPTTLPPRSAMRERVEALRASFLSRGEALAALGSERRRRDDEDLRRWEEERQRERAVEEAELDEGDDGGIRLPFSTSPVFDPAPVPSEPSNLTRRERAVLEREERAAAVGGTFPSLEHLERRSREIDFLWRQLSRHSSPLVNTGTNPSSSDPTARSSSSASSSTSTVSPPADPNIPNPAPSQSWNPRRIPRDTDQRPSTSSGPSNNTILEPFGFALARTPRASTSDANALLAASSADYLRSIQRRVEGHARDREQESRRTTSSELLAMEGSSSQFERDLRQRERDVLELAAAQAVRDRDVDGRDQEREEEEREALREEMVRFIEESRRTAGEGSGTQRRARETSGRLENGLGRRSTLLVDLPRSASHSILDTSFPSSNYTRNTTNTNPIPNIVNGIDVSIVNTFGSAAPRSLPTYRTTTTTHPGPPIPIPTSNARRLGRRPFSDPNALLLDTSSSNITTSISSASSSYYHSHAHSYLLSSSPPVDNPAYPPSRPRAREEGEGEGEREEEEEEERWVRPGTTELFDWSSVGEKKGGKGRKRGRVCGEGGDMVVKVVVGEREGRIGR